MNKENKNYIMNKNSRFSEPIPGSEKIYVAGKIHNILVPMREIKLSDTITSDGKVIKN